MSEPFGDRETTTATAHPNGEVTTQAKDGILLIGLNRPAKRNALTPRLLSGIAEAYARYEADGELRCAVLYGHGPTFCAGADLHRLQDSVKTLSRQPDAGKFDPLQLAGPTISKPLIVAVHGLCIGGGMELALAGDIIIAAEGTRLGQPETARGIFAFGGGAVRWPLRVGWGNAQRYLLSGELLDATEALRIGLVQEVVAVDELGQRALELAASIKAAAPRGVRDTLAVGRRAVFDGPAAAIVEQAERREAIMTTADAQEGLRSFLERRPARYIGM
jgi:enoyl-CoA hydratase